MDHIKKFSVGILLGLAVPTVVFAATADELFPLSPPPFQYNVTAPPGGFDMTAPISPVRPSPSPAPADQFNMTSGRPADQLTGTNGTPPGGTSETIVFPNPSPYDTVMEILEAILRALVSILIPVITVMIVYSGYLFVTAGGDTKKLEDAKKMLLGVVIGAALILGAWVLAQAIANTINGLG